MFVFCLGGKKKAGVGIVEDCLRLRLRIVCTSMLLVTNKLFSKEKDRTSACFILIYTVVRKISSQIRY